jgi:predicted AAA+ superfamily ATPase
MDRALSAISGIVARRLLEVADRRLDEEPVIALQGPRTVGKSTLLTELARSKGVDVVDLDDPAMRAAVRADPGAFVGDRSPVCIDEYQHIPEVLDAIKAELSEVKAPAAAAISAR